MLIVSTTRRLCSALGPVDPKNRFKALRRAVNFRVRHGWALRLPSSARPLFLSTVGVNPQWFGTALDDLGPDDDFFHTL